MSQGLLGPPQVRVLTRRKGLTQERTGSVSNFCFLLLVLLLFFVTCFRTCHFNHFFFFSVFYVYKIQGDCPNVNMTRSLKGLQKTLGFHYYRVVISPNMKRFFGFTDPSIEQPLK